MKDSEVTWYGQRCVLLGISQPGTTLSALCFVHEDLGDEAKKRTAAKANIADVFEARILDQLAEYQCHFMCVGLYRDSKLVGFWDVPQVWLEGRPLLTAAETREPAFQALMAAADTRAAANPVIPVIDTFGQIGIDFAAETVAGALAEVATPKPVEAAAVVDDEADPDEEITEAELAAAANEMLPAVTSDEPLPDITNHIDLEETGLEPIGAATTKNTPENAELIFIPNITIE